MGRPPCCDKLNVKRGVWTAEEDAKILTYVSKHGNELKRCGKSCRHKWTNYMRQDMKHESFTPQEEEMIIRLHAAIGSRWPIIAQQLPGRTDNDVKNYWNNKLKKKLTEMGIDPVTHKPFSQILADYGSIGGFPKSGPGSTRIGSLNRDLKNAFLSRSESKDDRFTIKTTPNPKAELHVSNNDDNMNLLAQLQAIKLVTDSNIGTRSYVFGEASSFSCSSSTSSTCSSVPGQEAVNTTSFSWQDFLLEDPFLPVDGPKEEEQLVSLSQELDCGVVVSGTYSQNTTSFVETLLEQDHQMMHEFPTFLDDPFYY